MKLIELLRLEFIANSTIGSFSTQSVWLGCTTILRICPMDQLANSVAPSIWGWNAVDILSFVSRIWWTSCQNFDMNFESLSDTINSGMPWRWTISLMYFHANSMTMVVVFTGIRWTINVRWHMTIHSLVTWEMGQQSPSWWNSKALSVWVVGVGAQVDATCLSCWLDNLSRSSRTCLLLVASSATNTSNGYGCQFSEIWSGLAQYALVWCL